MARPPIPTPGLVPFHAELNAVLQDAQDSLDALTSGKQAADADLTAIAALTPANDDVIQRKSGAWTNRTPAQLKTDLALAKADVGLNNVTNDAQVALTGDQTISGVKTFSGTAPSYGSNLAPALASWTLGGSAAYSVPNITIGAGAGTISADIAVTSGTLYQIGITASPSSGGDITFALGAATDTCASSLKAAALVAPSTGTLTLTISGASWSATISAITVRAVTKATPGVVAGVGELRAYSSNTAVGTSAQQSQTTGYGNTAVGYNAQQSQTTGYDNTAVGTSAQYSQTTGYANTAVGTSAQYSQTTGYDNTAVGRSAQYSQTTGYGNTAVGRSAQLSQTTGYSNTAVGTSAQQSQTTGYSNTAVGRSAQYAPLGNASYATTTAAKQTAIGMESGQSSATQVDGITTVGYRAVAGAANATALGYQARADHSGGVALGDNSTTTADNQVEIAGRHIEMVEMTAPSAGAANSARLFARDNGSGKTQLCVQFATGAVQVIATEP